MRLLDPTNPAAWLFGSFLGIVLATNIGWLVLRRNGPNPALRAGALGAAGWLALGLVYLLVPFLALRSGAISPYAMGLTEINWPATLSTGLVLAATVVVVILFGWLLYRRSLPEGPPPAPVDRFVTALRGPASAILQQWHWAFYRAAVAAALLTLPQAGFPPALESLADKLRAEPLYWGAWLGIALAGIEWTLDPFGRAALRIDSERVAALRRAALAVATTGLFVLTRNLWLCLAAHLVVETLAATWFALPEQPSSLQAD